MANTTSSESLAYMYKIIRRNNPEDSNFSYSLILRLIYDIPSWFQTKFLPVN